MTIDDVLTLAKAGYTRDEIAQMLQPDPKADPAPAPADPAPADPAPAPADPAPADPAPAPAEPARPAQESTPAWARALSESLAALTKAVQTNNAMHDEQPPVPAQSALDAALMKQLH